jgi:hypothetical protein
MSYTLEQQKILDKENKRLDKLSDLLEKFDAEEWKTNPNMAHLKQYFEGKKWKNSLITTRFCVNHHKNKNVNILTPISTPDSTPISTPDSTPISTPDSTVDPKILIMKINCDFTDIEVSFNSKTQKFTGNPMKLHKVFDPTTKKNTFVLYYDTFESKYITTTSWFGFGKSKTELKNICYIATIKFTDFESIKIYYNNKIYYNYNHWYLDFSNA